MSVHSLMLAFIGWVAVAAVFEILHWAVTRFCSLAIRKVHLCEGYWIVVMVIGFLMCDRLPDIKTVIPPFVVYMIHTSLIGNVWLHRAAKGCGSHIDASTTRMLGKMPDQ